MRLGDNPGDDLILYLGSEDVCCIHTQPLNYIRIICYSVKALMQFLKLFEAFYDSWAFYIFMIMGYVFILTGGFY